MEINKIYNMNCLEGIRKNPRLQYCLHHYRPAILLRIDLKWPEREF